MCFSGKFYFICANGVRSSNSDSKSGSSSIRLDGTVVTPFYNQETSHFMPDNVASMWVHLWGWTHPLRGPGYLMENFWGYLPEDRGHQIHNRDHIYKVCLETTSHPDLHVQKDFQRHMCPWSSTPTISVSKWDYCQYCQILWDLPKPLMVTVTYTILTMDWGNKLPGAKVLLG